MFKRFQSVWGPRDQNADRWARHGAPNYLTKDVCPLFLDTSASESKEFRAGLAAFHDDLTAMGIPHIYEIDPDQRGHQVTTDPKILQSIYEFFHQHLN
jgi:hypothetical protein